MMWAATQASSAHNSQPWEFVVLPDQRVRAEFGELIRAAAEADDPLPPQPATRSDWLIDAGARHLPTHLGCAPAIILVYGADVYPPGAPDKALSVQRPVLGGAEPSRRGPRTRARRRVHDAAQAHGTRDRELLAIPDEITIGVTMPVGRPARPFGAIVRNPVPEVLHRDRW